MVWKFLKKLGIKPPYDPAIPLLGKYPEEIKIKKGIHITMCENHTEIFNLDFTYVMHPIRGSALI